MAAYAALVSLMHIIDNLQLHPHPPISLHKNHVYLLTQKISFLQEFLEVYNPHLGYNTEADPLESRIADAAYAAEDVIETHIVDRITNDEKKISSDDSLYEALEKVIEEMTLIEKEAMEIKLETVGLQHDQQHTKSTPSDSSISSSSIPQKCRMVGADELLLQVKDKLTSDRLDLQIIPITGMGGSGKTALATNIYQDRLSKEHFHIRAWVTISQEFSIPEILQQLIKQLLDQEVSHLSEGELGDMLHRHLYGRKYLIVLDDMWRIRAWDGVRMFLPNNTNGSRIVVTTRLSNLASQLPNSSILKMNLLDEDDSWDLLSKTVFGEMDCPLEFEEIGKEIGKSCKGLPLSIVVVGGLLAKSTHTREFWEYIEENLNSIVNLEDNERCLKILYMSYKQLPVHLKPCFLYMGVFPEDEEIRISKIIKLWVSEGFLKPVSTKSMEEIAKEYLEDLIGRNLILIHELGITGKIYQCKIHDLLRDLCLREAKKERFYTVVSSLPSPQRIVNAAQRRIVVSSSTSKDEAINALSSMPQARSLIWNLENNELPPLNLMRLLRILESSWSFSHTTEACLESMHQLVNSRYINILGGLECPHSIGQFWNLQTLYCKPWQLRAQTFIWDMIQIRHIQFDDLMYLDYDQLEGDNVLENLQTLGPLSNFKCSKEIVKRIPNIKKLTIYYSETIYDDKHCLNNIVCLDKLESLTCNFSEMEEQEESGPRYLQRLIDFPNSLIKLSLLVNGCQCCQDILDKIGELPFLQKLELYRGSFKQGKWETTEGGFRSLKFLSLNSCDGLQVWKTESSHFPCLERLRLRWIKELEEIPLDFAEISTLRVIEVWHCSDFVVESAKRIVEEQEELYREEAALQVQVELWRENKAALESLGNYDNWERLVAAVLKREQSLQVLCHQDSFTFASDLSEEILSFSSNSLRVRPVSSSPSAQLPLKNDSVGEAVESKIEGKKIEHKHPETAFDTLRGNDVRQDQYDGTSAGTSLPSVELQKENVDAESIENLGSEPISTSESKPGTDILREESPDILDVVFSKISAADSTSSSISDYEIEHEFAYEIAEEEILPEDNETKISRNMPNSVSDFDSQQRVESECHEEEIRAVKEIMMVTDAENYNIEQHKTIPTSSYAGRSKHHEESTTSPIYFQEKGLYLVVKKNMHLLLKMDNQITLIEDYPSPLPPESSPVNAVLSLVEQDLRELPEKSSYPNSLILFLQRNKRLTLIHPLFFDAMPDLYFLDMSDTKIRTLPSSLFSLRKLKVLLLRNCICLEKIPADIVNLNHMEVLDLSGTELYDLPDEIGQLKLLKSIKLSFYGPDDESEYEHLPSRLVSSDVLSELKGIQALGICVHPEDYRWTETIACIIKDINKLEMLNYLQFYFPEVEMFENFIETSPSWEKQRLSKFNLIIGQNVKRIASRVPNEVESFFSQQDRCLRYVNGDKTSPLIKTALIRVTALYLDHHTEVQSLSEFDISNFQALEFCVVRECPKIKAILDEKKAGSAFPRLEYLGIYFLWELKHIWKLHSHAGRLKRIFKMPTPSRNFEALRYLTINTCPKLQFVFWESMIQCLANLEELVVEDCEGMEKIVKEENKKVKYKNNVLPRLRKLVLHYLPELVSLGYSFRLSEEKISVYGCPKLILNS